MQRSSRDPSVDFYDHSTARGSTPGADYFHNTSMQRNRRYGGHQTPDSSSISGGIPSRSASQLAAMRAAGDLSAGGGLTSDTGRADDVPESLADEVPARHLSVIEVARQMLLPVFYERLLDRHGLIAACGTVLDQFLQLEQMGLREMGAPEGATVDANQPLTEQDIAAVQRLVDGQLQELQAKRPMVAAGDGLGPPQHQQAGGGAASSAAADGRASHQRSAQAEADALMMMDGGGSVHGSGGHGGRISGMRGAGEHQTLISGADALSSPGAPPSIFRSVMYSAKGPLPPPPPPPLPSNQTAASDAFLRLSLDPPHLTTSNADIVITGVVHTKALIDLRWWIAYGPMKLVIDLEKLRSVGAVGTFQVSHSAFILSVGAGTLIPGAEYTVHVQAMAVDFAGIGKDARVEFVVPVAEDETQDILWNRMQRMTTSGYGADTEKGVLSLRPDPAKMKELEQEYAAAKEQAKLLAQQRDKQAHDKKIERERRGRILAASKAGKIDSAMASRLLMTGQGLPQEIEDAMEEERRQARAAAAAAAAGGDDDAEANNAEGAHNLPGTQLPDAAIALATADSPDTLRAGGGRSASGRGMTYHEQLRNFILNEVEPVYTLCAAPKFTHDTFTSLLKKVTKQYWYARPAGSGVLDADLKREMLAELRKEIQLYMVQSAGKTLVQRGSGASPEAARLLQESLEHVDAQAEVHTVSLLSPDQRRRLSGAARTQATEQGTSP